MPHVNFRTRVIFASAFLAFVLAACNKPADPSDTPAADPGAKVDAIEPASPSAPPAAAAVAKFDRNTFPVSEADMGEFPFVTLPSNYSSEGRTNKTMQVARFPFWVNGDSHWVEGKFQLTEFTVAEGSPTEFSQFEAKRHLEALVKQWGGSKVSEADIPQEAIDSWGNEITQGFNGGLGDVYNEPASTYFIRRNDGDVWIHLVVNTAQGWTVVGKQDTIAP